jgi:excisionase family DNA binding protein
MLSTTLIRAILRCRSRCRPFHRGLPNRLMTAFEVAQFVGCHDETIRRAYLRGVLTSQRFGVSGRRFHPADVLDWIRRGAPTRSSYMSLTK